MPEQPTEAEDHVTEVPTDDEYVQQRRSKADRLRELGLDPFWGTDFQPQHAIQSVRDQYDAMDAETLDASGETVELSGRITALRRFGKAGFAEIADATGRIQVHFAKDQLNETGFELFKKVLDLGDFIGVRGPLFRTKTDELTVRIVDLHFHSKALRGLPEKWHGLTDVETRYRQRYLDMLANDDSRKRFTDRVAVIRAIRRFFDDRGFLEVETPMLQGKASGAAARPFETHHNALDIPLVLRIAPELYLKRLVVGGFDRVYEINRNFRNEGISTQHNPEFTMLEFYQAYATVDDLMDLTEELIRSLAQDICGTTTVTYQGQDISFDSFDRASVYELICRHTDISDESVLLAVGDTARAALDCDVPKGDLCRKLLETFNPPDLAGILQAAGLDDVPPPEQLEEQAVAAVIRRFCDDQPFRAKLIDAVDHKSSQGEDPRVLAGAIAMLIFEAEVEDKLQDPTFVTEFPLAVSPLARRLETRRDDGTPVDSHLTARFELMIAGREIANGFQELNDPDDQRKRFEFQARAKGYGDAEATGIDEDYLRALEHGLPPTSGEGIGIDRLVMLLTDAPSIRDVILFPLARPRQQQ